MVSSVKSSRKVWFGAAAAVALGLGGFGFKRYRSSAAPAETASLAAVEQGDIEVHFMDSGEITPKLGVDVPSKVSGRVLEMLVEEGQKVRKGQKLAVIQPGRTESEQYVPVAVTSPIDGTVMRYQQGSSDSRMTKVGDYLTGLADNTNPTYLLTVADLSRLIVRMKISEMDILKLHDDMAVTVTADALPGETFQAKVSLISPQADKDSNNLKSFKVEVALPRADARLKPGMTARVDGLLDSRKGVLKIPLSAVFEEGGKEQAYVEVPGARPVKTVLKLGLRSETEAEVLSGLKAGQKVHTEKPEEKKS